MAIGRFDLAIQLLQDALTPFEQSGWDENSFPNTRSEIVSRLSRIHARLGNLDKARREQSELERFWSFPRAQEMIGSHSWKAQHTSVRAELAFASGNLKIAEAQFRTAVDISGFSTGAYGYLNSADMRAGLIRALLLQGRLSEAEAASRDALASLNIGKSAYPNSYSAQNAAPVVALAEVYLEQARPADAELVARGAINMLEHDCASPESLGLIAARKTLIQVLAEQDKWHDLLQEVDKARTALRQYPNLYQRAFGQALERIEAEIQAGDTANARSQLERVKAPVADKHGADSYQVAEINALIAAADVRGGEAIAAMPSFSAAVSALLAKAPEVEIQIGTASRRGRIIDAYARALRGFVEKGQKTVAGINAVSEMLRVTAFHREAKVGQAFSAGYLRASVSDADLAALIRQEQDIAEEARAVGDILAYVSSAQAGGRAKASPDTLQERLRTLLLARQALRKEILQRFPDFAALTAPRPMTVDAMRAKLRANQSLIVFHVADDATFVWALSKAGDIAYATVPITRADLDDAVYSLRQSVDPGLLQTLGDIPRYDVELANELYRKLLQPVRQGWKDAEELIVVTNGALGTLPFSMLATKPGKRDDGELLFSGYRKVAWLGRQVNVTYLPSVNALKSFDTAVAQTAGTRPFVGFGDPYFNTEQELKAREAKPLRVANRGFALRSVPQTRSADSAELGSLPRLPDTRDEILAVAGSLGADPVRDVHLGERASETRVKNTDLTPYKVLSFATHGLVPGDLNGLGQPALALSSPTVTGEKNNDGLLTMNEILGLKLNADFAVLSACNTAAADGEGAEAVSGLGRAFFYAGARALLVSNWPVHSEATTDLMTRMFKSLANDDSLSRGRALRRAKLEQIDKGGFAIDGKTAFSYAHPIFWAPFTLVGDGGGAPEGS